MATEPRVLRLIEHGRRPKPYPSGSKLRQMLDRTEPMGFSIAYAFGVAAVTGIRDAFSIDIMYVNPDGPGASYSAVREGDPSMKPTRSPDPRQRDRVLPGRAVFTGAEVIRFLRLCEERQQAPVDAGFVYSPHRRNNQLSRGRRAKAQAAPSE